MRNLLDYCPEPGAELSLIVGFTLFFKNHMFLLILNLKLKLIATYFVIIYFLWLSFTPLPILVFIVIWLICSTNTDWIRLLFGTGYSRVIDTFLRFNESQWKWKIMHFIDAMISSQNAIFHDHNFSNQQQILQTPFAFQSRLNFVHS